VAVGAVVVALVGAGCDHGDDDDPPPPQASGPVIDTERGTATPYGTGAQQVWVLRPASGEPRSIVVYLHGYGAYLPFAWHLRWMDHLLENGSIVLFPRYQPGLDDPFVLTPFDLAEGLQTGFDAIGYDGEPVVAAGFSLGAALAVIYAAHAEEWDVPSHEASTRSLPCRPGARTSGSTVNRRGDERRCSSARTTRSSVRTARDPEGAGRPSASLKQLRVIRTTDDLFADHEAPTVVDNPTVRETFWTPLDRLVEASRDG
jgi:pimeloyl-ACP methyl ester carboxylesterase